MTDTLAYAPDPALLRSALAAAGRGWRVFPCACGGKRPALRGSWQEHATTEPARVRAWWSRAAFNIGIACGPSGLVVIDLDVPRAGEKLSGADAGTVDGVEALAALCERHGQPYPVPTYAVATPSGGSHLYYLAPAGAVSNSAGRLGSRIDVRASGGYVIGCGSQISGRAYTARDERFPIPMPDWIADLLRDEPSTSTALGVPGGRAGAAYGLAALRAETRLVAAARPGTRNDTLNRAAFSLGQLTAGGLLPPQAAAGALAAAAERAGLPAGEARRTIRSGMDAGARHPRRPQSPVRRA